MTTIAFDGRTMAADSQMNVGDRIEPQSVRKIYKVDDCLVGFAGSWPVVGAVLKWLTNKEDVEKAPQSDHEWELLVIYPNGKAMFFCNKAMCWTENAVPGSIGSGSDFAIAAMLAGADAAKAVDIATRLDLRSGGAISTLEI